MRTMMVALMSFGLACSSESPSPPPGGGNPPAPAPTTTEEAGTPPPPPPPEDAGQPPPPPPPPPPPVVNGCSSYVDMTANGATINGPSNAAPAQFSPNCVHVRAGQSVTWNVELSAHPLGASGGDTPSPITTTVSGNSVTFAFPNAGAFGYHCLAHPTIMFGAVWVTP